MKHKQHARNSASQSKCRGEVEPVVTRVLGLSTLCSMCVGDEIHSELNEHSLLYS